MLKTAADRRVLLLILIAALGTVLVILFLFRIDSDLNRRNIEFISAYGWQVDSEPVDTANINIPREFNAVFETYNTICQNSGFDLSNFKGARAVRYSYRVLNHQDSESGLVRANVFVVKNNIIAGDISSLKAGGFIQPISDTTGIVQ
ncbi:MAG: DUF4830 domain-containing protein [Clostridia bacterium]|nr:DUF4830 domain-containing protein [Clostridia bacterium]